MCVSSFSVDKSVVPCKRKHKEKKLTKQSTDLFQSLTASLGKGTALRTAVKCPEGTDLNSWIAMNSLHFPSFLNSQIRLTDVWILTQTATELYKSKLLCYGMVSEFCTPDVCPTMSGGPSVEYRWPVPSTDKKSRKETPVSMPAAQYVDNLAEWCFTELNDTAVFVRDGETYPKTFLPACKKILSRLFRVYAHIYNCHWAHVRAVKAEAHINTSFKHFYFFVTEFRLVDEKAMEPLRTVIHQLTTAPAAAAAP